MKLSLQIFLNSYKVNIDELNTNLTLYLNYISLTVIDNNTKTQSWIKC